MADHRFPGEWMKDGIVLGAKIKPGTLIKLESMDFSEGDVVIACYPKTGTTWLQELVWLLCHNCDIREAREMSAFERVPYLEYDLSGFEQLRKLSPPYQLKTHFQSETFRAQIDQGKVKTIIGIRNPKDTLVSFYHFYRMHSSLGNFKGSWDDFFELYKTKHLIYGDYFQWYSSWLQHKDKPNVMLVKYEDMHRRMADVINKMSNFLCKPIPQESIADVIQHLTFDSMSRNDMTNYKGFPFFDMSISPFMRKGQIGDWKNYFSEEQSALVDKQYKDVIEAMGVTLEFE